MDHIVDGKSMPFCKPRDYRRPLKHVDIIVGACHAEERVPNPDIL
jgi:hypothetical protein